MPFYEYRCQKCNEVLEVMQPMSAKSLSTCGENCVCDENPGNGKLTRLLSVTAVHSGSPAGLSKTGGDLPACGRCGVPGGPCAMGSGMN